MRSRTGPLKRFSFKLLRAFYLLRGWQKQGRAKLRGRVFACGSLGSFPAIESVIVNSDGTVTCDCRDITGEGQIGNIIDEPLETLYRNEKASRFRQALYSGKLPMLRCAQCTLLREISPRRLPELRIPNTGRVIQNLSLETTVLCNYDCRGCMREIIYAHRAGRILSGEQFRQVLQRFATYDVKRLWFYNQGEPTMAKDFPEQLRLARDLFPQSKIYFSSNGHFIDNDRIRQAIVDCVTALEVSIDGPDQQTAERYQKGIDFARVVKNLKDLVQFRDRLQKPTPGVFWKYVLFAWNDSRTHLERIVALAKDAGVDGIMFFPARTPFYGVPWHFHLSRKRYGKELGLTRTTTGELLMGLRNPVLYPFGGTAEEISAGA